MMKVNYYRRWDVLAERNKPITILLTELSFAVSTLGTSLEVGERWVDTMALENLKEITSEILMMVQKTSRQNEKSVRMLGWGRGFLCFCVCAFL